MEPARQKPPEWRMLTQPYMVPNLHCLVCPVRPLFYCYHFTTKSPQKFLLCPRPVLHVYPPITLIPQTHLTSYSTLDAFWNFLHSFNSHLLITWCSRLWWYRSEPWRQRPSFTTFQSWERAGKTWHLKDRGPKGRAQMKHALQTRFYSRCDGKAMEDLHRAVKLTHKPLLKLSPILPETLFSIIFQMLKDTNASKSNSKITN